MNAMIRAIERQRGATAVGEQRPHRIGLHPVREERGLELLCGSDRVDAAT